MADINDIARVEYVLNNYDNITLLRDKKGEILTSYEYKNKDNKPAPLLLIQKKNLKKITKK